MLKLDCFITLTASVKYIEVHSGVFSDSSCLIDLPNIHLSCPMYMTMSCFYSSTKAREQLEQSLVYCQYHNDSICGTGSVT